MTGKSGFGGEISTEARDLCDRQEKLGANVMEALTRLFIRIRNTYWGLRGEKQNLFLHTE